MKVAERICTYGVDGASRKEAFRLIVNTDAKAMALAMATNLGQMSATTLRISYRLTPREASIICALPQLVATRETRPMISAPEDVLRVMRGYGSEDREKMWVFCLDARSQLVERVEVAKGTRDCCLIYPRDIFRAVLASGIGAFIVVHNHPSGDPSPSDEDCSMTRKLNEGGRLIGLQLIDSLIIAGDDKYVSLREEGVIHEECRNCPGW